MKSLIAAVLIKILLVSSIHAEDKAVTMRTLLDGINLIQLGLLTNSEVLVEEGISEIQEGRKVLETVDRSHYMSFDEVQAHAFTKQKTNRIYMYAKNALKEYNNGNTFKALEEYKLLVRQCIECHRELRDYQDKGNGLR